MKHLLIVFFGMSGNIGMNHVSIAATSLPSRETMCVCATARDCLFVYIDFDVSPDSEEIWLHIGSLQAK